MRWAKASYNCFDLTASYKHFSPLDAAQFNVQKIINDFNPPYYLMVSGGIDSQAMLYAWLKFGKDFIPTSVIYNNNFNLHDVGNISNFANQYNLKINYLDFDLLGFYKNEFDSYSEIYRCSSPCISAHIKMTENLKGTVIFSGDPIFSNILSYTDAILGLYRASLIRDNLVPYFFCYTPEIVYNFYINKIVNTTVSGYVNKYKQYHEFGFPVIPQESKFSGFEKVKDYYDLHYKHLVSPFTRLKYAKKLSKRTFDILLRYPYEEKYNDQEYTFIFNKQ